MTPDFFVVLLTYLFVIIVLTSDRDTMKFDPWAGELGDRNGSEVERVHATGENPPLTGDSPCLKLLVKLYDIGGGGYPYESGSKTLERQINGPRGDLSLSSLLP